MAGFEGNWSFRYCGLRSGRSLGGFSQHGLDQTRLTHLPGDERRHVATVAEHRRPIAHPHHLTKPVGDEEHRSPLVPPLVHHAEDLFGLIGGESGSDFVEHQDGRLPSEGTSEIDQAERGERQVSDLLIEVDSAHLHALKPLDYLLLRDVREAEVFGNCEIGDQGRILENGRETSLLGLGRIP